MSRAAGCFMARRARRYAAWLERPLRLFPSAAACRETDRADPSSARSLRFPLRRPKACHLASRRNRSAGIRARCGRDCPEGRRMPSAKVAVEIRHEAGFLGALGRIVPHIGVEVMDHPMLRDRHMAYERMAIDDGDAAFAE